MAEDGGRKKARRRKNNNESSANTLGNLATILDQRKKQKKATVVMEFQRDPISGRRIYKSKYRPNRKSTRAADEDNDDFCESAMQDYLEDDYAADDFDELIKEVDHLLCGWKGKKKRDWGKRMEVVNTNWQASRKCLFEEVLKSSSPNVASCGKCNSESAIFRCSQCSYRTLCTLCDEEVHSSNPFHDREVFNGGFYQPIKPTVSVSEEGEIVQVVRKFPFHPVACPVCKHDMQAICSTGQCIIITMQGRFDLDVISHYYCSECSHSIPYELTSQSVISMGFWPGTPSNICHLFDRELLRFWDLAQKRMPGVSERSFIASLGDYSLAKGRTGVINISTFSRAFKEWKFCMYELDLIQQKNWMDCPACSKKQHSGHVDGNMKLYRFNSAGRRQRQSYYNEAFIASNSKVDSHIQAVYKGAKNKELNVGNSKCGDSSWRAAGNAIKKKKNLDETGLEILGCRHSIAQAAINMFYGEVYGYAYYLQKVFLIPRKVQFLWYDIVCKYWPWLRKQDPNAAQCMKPALSVMHAKAHSWTCQVLWGGRWQKGASATTGEEVEQINSHFSRLGNSTKHMLPEGREELLTEHALSWNRKKVEQLPLSLLKRFVKVKQHETDTYSKLVSLLEANGFSEDSLDETINKWIHDVQDVAREEELARTNKVTITFNEEVFLAASMSQVEQSSPEITYLLTRAEKLFPKFFAKIRSAGHEKVSKELSEKCANDNSWSASLKQGETAVFQNVEADLQFKIESLHFSILQLTTNIGKLTDSSKQRTRLRSKLTATKADLKEHVNDLKMLQPTSDLNVEEIQQGIFPWLPVSRQGVPPFCVKKSAAELAVECRRFAEEAELLKQEMVVFLAYYKDVVIPALKRQEEILVEQLKDAVVGTPSFAADLPAAATSPVSTESETIRYATDSREENILQGKIALTRRGVDFALGQIASGITVFRKVLAGNSEEMSQVLSEYDDCESEDYQADDTDESDDEEVDITKASPTNADPDRTEAETLLPVVRSSLDSNGIHVWKFPVEFNQGCVDGRNGSSACSIIALVMAQVVSATTNLKTPKQGVLSPLWSTLVYQSMVAGNDIYDTYRASLPARYLSAAEAFDIMARADSFGIELEDPLPVRLVDQHHLSTIETQLQLLAETPNRKVAVFTISERTSLFIVDVPYVILVDTHCHLPDGGAVILVGQCNMLLPFCTSVWEMQGLDSSTFGNLVVISAP